MRIFFQIFVLIFSLNLFQLARAEVDTDAGYLTFCKFGPKVRILTPKEPPEADRKDSCEIHVRVQALIWECETPTHVDATLSNFVTQLNSSAEQKCRTFCSNRGRKCVGRFDKAKKCGLGTDTQAAIKLGQDQFKCRKDCAKGVGFVYCSIYDAGFQTDVPEMTAKQPANCHCSST
jgi:hypothetical protein